jgi:hypothetical protein
MEDDYFRGSFARLQRPPAYASRFGFPYTGKAGFRLPGWLCRAGFGLRLHPLGSVCEFQSSAFLCQPPFTLSFPGAT